MTHTTHTRRPGLAATAAAVVLLFATAAGCSDNPDVGGKPAPTTVPTTSDTSDTSGGNGDSGGGTPTALPTGSDDWQERLDALPQNGVAACQQPSTHACAEAVDAITEVVLAMENDITTHGWEDAYAETAGQLETMHEGAVAYDTEGCEDDPAADTDGSSCYGAALDVVMGPAVLEMTLVTDEATARHD